MKKSIEEVDLIKLGHFHPEKKDLYVFKDQSSEEAKGLSDLQEKELKEKPQIDCEYSYRLSQLKACAEAGEPEIHAFSNQSIEEVRRLLQSSTREGHPVQNMLAVEKRYPTPPFKGLDYGNMERCEQELRPCDAGSETISYEVAQEWCKLAGLPTQPAIYRSKTAKKVHGKLAALLDEVHPNLKIDWSPDEPNPSLMVSGSPTWFTLEKAVRAYRGLRALCGHEGAMSALTSIISKKFKALFR